ncbi:uncharacterized protein LOC18434559 [Amborella trichopoda]|uniref:Uncharacterized protein n=1 Tax=Amborella trichopoda TaxID=13333 RepID=W1PGY8_AMBTC|nr:uncharacterized protein LOC18434559 [Amborella trichopoda]ERN06365.1 hypothetical protein AMTR_s00016p00245420 [Amborella trichopoda]|eukprot:XP_006844690.1 uncharacterized protein LOC18434559 [Amborella trichopoda]
MAVLLIHLLSSFLLFSLGLYQVLSSTKSYLRSPRDYAARLYHPFPFSLSSLKHLPLYLLIFSLSFSLLHQLLLSSAPDPLVKGSSSVYHFSSLQIAAVLFIFLFLSLAILLSETTTLFPLPNDVFCLIASVAFSLHYTVSISSSSLTLGIEGKCDAISARISAASAVFSLILAFNPRFFVADLALGASICLQGLWVLQTGLSLYAEAFIPEGCHQLLDVATGVEGSTRCDLEESRFRAMALLDLVFLFHVIFVLVVVVLAYAVLMKFVGVRRLGPYEALPTTTDSNHVQMKSLSGTQA